MLSNRPYLIRAFHQWIIDSSCTPILVLDATNPRCKIPKEYIEGGEIVFNISPSAVRDLKITNELIEFTASFSGIVHIVSAPVQAIISVYAEENGEGLYLDGEEDGGEADGLVRFKEVMDGDGMRHDVPAASDVPSSGGKNKPFLTLVE